jgi:hypothetical protein
MLVFRLLAVVGTVLLLGTCRLFHQGWGYTLLGLRCCIFALLFRNFALEFPQLGVKVVQWVARVILFVLVSHYVYGVLVVWAL